MLFSLYVFWACVVPVRLDALQSGGGGQQYRARIVVLFCMGCFQTIVMCNGPTHAMTDMSSDIDMCVGFC